MRALRAILVAVLTILLSGSVVSAYGLVQRDQEKTSERKALLTAAEVNAPFPTANRPSTIVSVTVATTLLAYARDDACDAGNGDNRDGHCCGVACHTPVGGGTDDACANDSLRPVTVAEPSSLYGTSLGRLERPPRAA